MSRALALFATLLSFGMFYNLLTMIMHYQVTSPGNGPERGQSQFLADPVTPNPLKNERNSRIKKSPFHVAVTATDSPYSQWQCRVMYYWYMKKKDLPGSEMGRFTRILHSGENDYLMKEIPTFVVDPLPEGVDKGYIVLNRPWAFVQWLEKAKIEEEYVLMAEPDHIFLKPLPNLAYDGYPSAYPFFYIKPVKYEKIVQKFFPPEKGPITDVDPIGNSPVIIQKSILQSIAPTWMNVSLDMKNDMEADQKFGWVLEMYAYAVASAIHGVSHILRKDFQIQPPYDVETNDPFILHYTYGSDFNSKGELVEAGGKADWRFDKRDYLLGPPPRDLPLPPKSVPESMGSIVKLINEASANIPNWYSVDPRTSRKSNLEVRKPRVKAEKL